MLDSEKPKFCAILAGLAAVLPGAKLPKEAYEFWWNVMQRDAWTLTEFDEAAAHLSKSCDFFPTPGHFDRLRKAGRMTAGEAWEKARKAAGSAIQCGQVTHNGTCGDPFIDSVVRAFGGYGQIAMCDTDKLHFLERRFTEHFATMLEAQDTREAVPQIAGPSASFRLPGPAKAGAVVARIGLTPPADVAKRLALGKKSA
jgi:hypothetical protein